MPVPLDREVGATLGAEVVVAGGNRGGATSGIVDAIDPRTGDARRLAVLPVAVHDAAGGRLDAGVVVFGGGAGAASASVQRVGADGTVARIGTLPQPRADVAAATAAGTIYLVGGYDGAHALPDVLATTDGAHFRTLATLPVAVRYPAVAVLGSTLYVIGGATSGGENAGVDTDAVQTVDLRTGAATVAWRLPQPRSHAVAMVLHHRLYVVGGHRAGAWTDEIVEVGRETGALRVVAHLPQPVSDGAVAVRRGVAYYLGGERAPDAPVADVVVLRPVATQR